MDVFTLAAMRMELEKIAEEKFAAVLSYFEKQADHVKDRIRERGGRLSPLLQEHANRIEQGLAKLHGDYGHVVKGIPEGATHHVDMPGGYRAIVQKIGGALRMKTVLSPGMTSTSLGPLQDILARSHKLMNKVR